jgi:hypothetical protein
LVITRYSQQAAVPDVRESYTLDPSADQQDVAYEQDAAHNGTWVQTSQETRPTLSKSRGPPQSVPDVVIVDPPADGATCASAQAMTAAFWDAVQRGGECLSSIDPDLATELATLANDPQTEFHLTCAALDADTCGQTSDGLHITLGSSAFGPQCGSLAEVIFHELLHNPSLLGRHASGDGRTDPGDRIYGCALGCFRSANSFYCAQVPRLEERRRR